MKCLETRVNADGIKRRRYLLDDGRRVSTLEVPASVLIALGMPKVRERLAEWRRGEALRARGQQIDALITAGWKPTAIAHSLGVSEAAVRQRRAKLQATK